MKKVLLDLQLRGETVIDQTPCHIQRTVYWPDRPMIGETVNLATKFSLYHDAKRVVHGDGDYVLIEFDTDNPDDLTELLGEEDGGWSDRSNS